jgi:hypothetical protein
MSHVPQTTRRTPAALLAACGACAALLLFSSHPAAAFYVPVKPAVKVGSGCVGKATQLAPALTACAVAGTRMRIWCPNGDMFEGAAETGDPAASLARSLCNMSQVSE